MPGAGRQRAIVALGGDGLMLQALHNFLGKGKPIYGMNLGSVGFLMNEYREDELDKRLAVAERAAVVHPLRMLAQTRRHARRGAGLQRSFAAAREPARPLSCASWWMSGRTIAETDL